MKHPTSISGLASRLKIHRTITGVYLTGKENSLMAKEYTPDAPEKAATGAIKYDGGKPCVWQGLINYFPRACVEVAAVSTFGANKYAWKGWEGVDNGFNRYSDALARHFMAEGREELRDPDSQLVHAAHTAWNAFARLELLLRDMENDKS